MNKKSKKKPSIVDRSARDAIMKKCYNNLAVPRFILIDYEGESVLVPIVALSYQQQTVIKDIYEKAYVDKEY